MLKGLTSFDLGLLGYRDVSEIDGFADWPCEVYKAKANAGLVEVSSTFVYLKSKATRTDAEKILNKLPKDAVVFLVGPESEMSKPEIKSLGSERNLKCYIYEDLVWEKIFALFGEYVKSLLEGIVPEKYFVQPRKENDAHCELDQELISFLQSKERQEKLRVLSAPAGVGKTTLARALTLRLARDANNNRVIPVYIEAKHWSKLQLDKVEGLWEIIVNSLNIYSSSLHINQDLFEHMLKNGYICFIFDGFDELCGHRYFPFRPNDVLDELAKLVKDSEARLLLTTRTAYWETEISMPPDNIDVVHLASFNTQQARGYFDQYFRSAQQDRDRAITLYSQLLNRIKPPGVAGQLQARARFANLPLCVSMVAQCVSLGPTKDELFRFEKGVIYGFLQQICEREKEREQLHADYDKQLSLFEQLTMECINQPVPEFDDDDLEIVGFDRSDINKITTHTHPLLARTNNNKYRFAYDFLPHYFKACHIASYIASPAPITLMQSTLPLMVAEANGKGFIFEHVLDICCKVTPENKIYKRINGLFRALPSKAHDEKSFLFHIAHIFAANYQSGRNRQDSSKLIWEALFGADFKTSRKVDSLVLIGKVDNMDLSGINFSNCRFMDVIFDSCGANEETSFNSCAFIGDLEFKSCDPVRWRDVKFDKSCVMQSPASLIWDQFIGPAGSSTEKLIKDAMAAGLSKFWKHGRLQSSIRQDNWKTGCLGHTAYGKSLLKAMLKVKLLTEGKTSGVQEGIYIFDRDSISNLQQFMDNKQLTGKLAEVYKMLREERTKK